MLVLLECYGDYDPRKQGTPWGVPCDSSGAPFFKGNAAYFSSGHGTGGCLYVENPPEGSVWVYGQKDYRLGYTPKKYAQCRSGVFYPVSESELPAVLNTSSPPPSTTAQQAHLNRSLIKELFSPEPSSPPITADTFMKRHNISKEELESYGERIWKEDE